MALRLIIIFLVIGFVQFSNLKGDLKNEFVNKNKYQALKWIQENTPEDSKVFMLEGSYQTEAAYTKRLTYQITIEDLGQKINELSQNKSLNLDFNSGWFTVAHWSRYRYKTGYLSYNSYTPLNTSQNIFAFDYIYLENINEIIGQYNAVLIEALTTKFNFSKAYEYGGYIILKNEDQ